MNLERVVFGFVTILALTFTFAFVSGDIDNASHHNVWVLTIAILINLIATGLKLGDRSQVGALLLANIDSSGETKDLSIAGPKPAVETVDEIDAVHETKVPEQRDRTGRRAQLDCAQAG